MAKLHFELLVHETSAPTGPKNLLLRWFGSRSKAAQTTTDNETLGGDAVRQSFGQKNKLTHRCPFERVIASFEPDQID